MADLSVNFSDVKQNSDDIAISLHSAVKRYALVLSADFFDNITAVSDFSVLYRALIGSSDEILTIIEDCLGPECFEKQADKVIEERLLALKEKLNNNDFYLYRQCLLTAFAGIAQNINPALKNKITLNLKINTDLPKKDLKDLLIFLLKIIKEPVKKNKIPLPDSRISENNQNSPTYKEQENNAGNDEIIMSKIRNLLSEAAEKAKAANLVPKETNDIKTLEIKKAENQTVSAIQEKKLKEDKELLLDSNETSKNEESNSDGELSLKDLARRAAKLQEEFRNERIKLAKEGKLPNPAKLPQNFPPKIKKGATANNTRLTSPLELFEERNKARVSKEPAESAEKTLKKAIISDDNNLKKEPKKEEEKADQNAVTECAAQIQATEDKTDLNSRTERFIASFDNEYTDVKQNSDFQESSEDDFRPVTFYHDAKTGQEVRIAKAQAIKPKEQNKHKISWLKRLFNFLFGRREDTVLLPYSIEKKPASSAFIDADTLPQALREKILKEQDLNKFKHFLTEQIINHNLPKSLEKLIDDFSKSFYELQQNPQYEDEFITFIKAPFSSPLNVSDKFTSLLFVLLILEADRQGYDIAYLFVGHRQIKERYDAVFSDQNYDSLTIEQQKSAALILTSLLSVIYRLQSYSLDNEGNLRALITENPCAKEESTLLIDVDENVMGHTVRIKSFINCGNNQGILIKCSDDKRIFRLNLICSNLPMLKKAQDLKEKLKPAFEYLGYNDPQIHIRLGSNLKVFLTKQPFFKDGLVCLRDETAADPVLRHQLQLNQYELIECLLKLLKDLNLCQCDKLGSALNEEDDLDLKLRPILAMRHLILKLCNN